MTIGNKIKQLRGELTYREFGARVGYNYSYLRKLENDTDLRTGKILNPTLSLLKQICDKSNYDFRTFLEETGYLSPITKSVTVLPPHSTVDWTAEEIKIIQKLRTLSNDQKQTVLEVLDISYNAQKESQSTIEKHG